MKNHQYHSYGSVPSIESFDDDIIVKPSKQINYSKKGLLTPEIKCIQPKIPRPIHGCWVASFSVLLLVILSSFAIYLDTHTNNDIINYDDQERNILLVESNLHDKSYLLPSFLDTGFTEAVNVDLFNSMKCDIYQFISNNNFTPCKSIQSDHRDNILTNSSNGWIYVSNDIKYQEILGFGVAFTEASGINYSKLPRDKQDQLMKSYFSTNYTYHNESGGGIGLNLGRSHINSCDFSISSYSFDDVVDDYELEYFDMNVTHDLEYLIPLIKKALIEEPNLRIQSAPWSPPAWMKKQVNGINSMTGSSSPHGLIWNDKILQSWALYISKWVTAYKMHGIDIWGISVQNEPEFIAPWEACVYNSTFETIFLRDYLGPRLRMDHSDINLYVFDHNKDHVYKWIYDMWTNVGTNSVGKNVRDYIDGVDFHWYSGGSRDLDGTYGYYNLNKTHDLIASDHYIIASEATSCPGVIHGSWGRAERLAHDILHDLLNWANGWSEWNLLVDYEGGPNHLGNNCDAPIFTSKDYSDIVYQPRFYYMGHFSKFIRPGSYRIFSNFQGNYNFDTDYGGPSLSIEGLEISTWGCEKSTRQRWSFNNNSFIELWDPSLAVPLCLSLYNDSIAGLTLINCNTEDQVSKWIYKNEQFILSTDQSKCLVITDDSFEPGSRVNIKNCNLNENNKLSKKWLFDTETKEIVSYLNQNCLTAGWPFFQAISFEIPNDNSNSYLNNIFNEKNREKKIGIVVLNEAEKDTTFEIIFKNKTFKTSVDKRSMQTYVF